ncbi:unnamed protein product [Paramecium pentaurelia]|uniref:Uncharacterized protein n=1 Tax=Paramecium pentaurelia TaxID=43138 RepID=A0A8S1RYJ9_9CILI|nr:unnamed protein product [Paramecium pentaurelia]
MNNKLLQTLKNKLQIQDSQIKLLQFYKKYCLPTSQTSNSIKSLQMKAYFNLIMNKSFFFGGPFCIKYGINMVSNPATIMYSPLFFIGYGVCYSAYVYFEGLRNRNLSEINILALREMSLQTYEHLLYLDAEFHLNTSSRSNIYSLYKAQKGIESNLRSLNQYFVPLLADISLTTAILCFNFGWPFFSSFLVTFVAYTAFTIRYSNYRRKIISQRKKQEKLADFTISQALDNLFTVKYFSAEKYELKRYNNLLEKLQQLSIDTFKTLATLNAIQRLILSMGLTVNLVLGVSGVQAGVITPGDLILIQSLMLQLIQPLFLLGTMHREWVESAIDMKDLLQIMTRVPKIQELPNAQDFIYKTGSIHIQDISFEHIENKQLFKNFNLQIKGGEWIVIVGESGIGKSTLFNLIFRLLDPSEGNISIDDQNIKTLKLESFRKYFGIVAQQSYFFNDSIKNNLLYGLDLIYDLTPEMIKQKEEEMKSLCKQLKLSKLIESLPNQYDTQMGDQANKFSGGEKQRLQIVRCLLRGAKILLLDEPTSALDQNNEQFFIETLEQVLKIQDLTVLIITHRLHLTKVADKILYLGKNCQFEYGTHDQLIQNHQSYNKYWEKYQKQ